MLGVGDVLDRIVGSKSGYNGWGPKDGLACPELNKLWTPMEKCQMTFQILPYSPVSATATSPLKVN